MDFTTAVYSSGAVLSNRPSNGALSGTDRCVVACQLPTRVVAKQKKPDVAVTPGFE